MTDRDLENRMRDVLLRLAMLFNGSSARMDANSSGGYYDDVIPQLGRFDAPHLYYHALWEKATSDEERARILKRATDELDAITHSRADFSAVETLYDLCERIVTEFEGLPKREAAVRARTSEAIVAKARRERGREEDYGRPPKDASGLPREERRRLVLSLAGQYSSAKAIASALTLSYSTVLRDLSRKS